jgi:hypothetical protein
MNVIIPHCPSVGKMYIIFFYCVVFMFTLTSLNIIKYKDGYSDDLKIPSIIFDVIACIATLYIIKVDVYDMYGDIEKCEKYNKCDWLIYDKKCKKLFNHNNIFLVLLTACSLYLIVSGIYELRSMDNDFIKNNKEIYTTLTYLHISSVVFGITCLIFVLSDIITLIHLFS